MGMQLCMDKWRTGHRNAKEVRRLKSKRSTSVEKLAKKKGSGAGGMQKRGEKWRGPWRRPPTSGVVWSHNMFGRRRGVLRYKVEGTEVKTESKREQEGLLAIHPCV